LKRFVGSTWPIDCLGWFFPLLAHWFSPRYSISSPGFSLSSLLLAPSCIISPLHLPALSPLHTLHTPSVSCLPTPRVAFLSTPSPLCAYPCHLQPPLHSLLPRFSSMAFLYAGFPSLRCLSSLGLLHVPFPHPGPLCTHSPSPRPPKYALHSLFLLLRYRPLCTPPSFGLRRSAHT
jgi:hypothetical protein